MKFKRINSDESVTSCDIKFEQKPFFFFFSFFTREAVIAFERLYNEVKINSRAKVQKRASSRGIRGCFFFHIFESRWETLGALTCSPFVSFYGTPDARPIIVFRPAEDLWERRIPYSNIREASHDIVGEKETFFVRKEKDEKKRTKKGGGGRGGRFVDGS